MSTDNIEIWYRWIRRFTEILLLLAILFVIWFACFDAEAATPESAGIWNRECFDYGLARED